MSTWKCWLLTWVMSSTNTFIPVGKHAARDICHLVFSQHGNGSRKSFPMAEYDTVWCRFTFPVRRPLRSFWPPIVSLEDVTSHSCWRYIWVSALENGITSLVRAALACLYLLSFFQKILRLQPFKVSFLFRHWYFWLCFIQSVDAKIVSFWHPPTEKSIYPNHCFTIV